MKIFRTKMTLVVVLVAILGTISLPAQATNLSVISTSVVQQKVSSNVVKSSNNEKATQLMNASFVQMDKRFLGLKARDIIICSLLLGAFVFVRRKSKTRGSSF